MIPALAVALLATACSSKDVLDVNTGMGTAEFAVQASANVTDVVTRASQGTLDASLLPSQSDFALAITGNYVDKDGNPQTYSDEWLSLEDYYTEEVKLNKGTYTATITSGNVTEEGVAKPYFVGELVGFTVKANTTQTYEITASLANSCFTFAVTNAMLNYYENIKLTIYTATNSFLFEPISTEASELYFVAADQVLSIGGTATKAQNGVEVEFPKTAIGVKDASGNVVDKRLQKQYRYAIVVDNSAVGNGNLVVEFDDTFTEVEPVEVELNPDVE